MRLISNIAVLAAGVSLAAAANAQAVTAGGSIDGRAGFGDNPYLQLNSPGSSPLVGATLTGWLQRRSDVARTRLTGVASLDQNFDHYGRAENYLVSLSHEQELSAKLSLTGEASYQDSITARDFSSYGGTTVAEVGTPIDLFAIGQRTRTVSADALLNWQPTSRDAFYVGPTFSHATYPGRIASDYNQYGLRGGYLRTINERLKIGVDVFAQRVNSAGFSNGTSVQASMRLVYDFSAIWQFDGTLGVIHQQTDAPFRSTSQTIGFTGKLCGKYPRYRVCLEAGRQGAPSGYGGLRVDNRASLNVEYTLSARSTVNLGATYDQSKSTGVSIIPTQVFWEVTGGYHRTLTKRLSAGVSAHYQHRDYGNIIGLADTSVSGYSATADVLYKFGRLDQ